MSYGVGCRLSSDPTLLWLWYRPVASAPIGPLAWELAYATGAALKRQKTKDKKKRYFQNLTTSYQFPATSGPPWIIAIASNMVSRLPFFLHHFGLSPDSQREPLKHIRPWHLSKPSEVSQTHTEENINPEAAYRASHALAQVIT